MMKTFTCSCGGTARLTTLRRYDFSAEAGFAVTLPDVQGYQCDKCGLTTLPGQIAALALEAVTLALLDSPARLAPGAARHLRRYLGETQAGLAERMGVTRETVNRWESGAESISPQSDHALRTFVLFQLAVEDEVLKILETLAPAMASVRRRAPPKRARVAPAAIAKYMDALADRRAA